MPEEQQEETTTQKLQNKVDRLKLLNLTDNIHHISSTAKPEEDGSRDIALVNVLSVSNRVKAKFLEIRGLEYDPVKKELIQVTDPIMNLLGAYRFCRLLQMAEEIEWASYSEEEINARIIHFFEENIPYFLFYRKEYELNEKDDYYIINTLQIFIDTSFHKSKSGKYINTLGRTYGEDVMKRALDTGTSQQQQKESGFLSKYNPFKESKWA
jgi:hypothetical protein